MLNRDFLIKAVTRAICNLMKAVMLKEPSCKWHRNENIRLDKTKALGRIKQKHILNFLQNIKVTMTNSKS